MFAVNPLLIRTLSMVPSVSVLTGFDYTTINRAFIPKKYSLVGKVKIYKGDTYSDGTIVGCGCETTLHPQSITFH